jgi:hypothetical protein
MKNEKKGTAEMKQSHTTIYTLTHLLKQKFDERAF